MLKKLLNLVFPNKCIFCEDLISSAKFICLTCYKNIVKIKKDICPVCSLIDCECKEKYIQAFCAVIYDNLSSNAVLKLKFHGIKLNAIPLGLFLYKNIKARLNDRIDVIIPVPLHFSDYLNRGYNQSELICKVLGRKLNCGVNTKILKKIKRTKKQHSLSQRKRASNLLGAYKANDIKDFKSSNILLVDDIFTTGNTLKECVRTLNDAGYKNIYIAAVFKTDKLN